MPEALKILSQLLINKVLSDSEIFTEKDVDNIAFLIGQLENEEIVQIVKKVEPKKPYKFLRRFCYNKNFSKSDLMQASKITFSFIARWKDLPAKMKKKIASLSS